MPIRELRCEHCECTFETLILRPRDEAEIECPKCRSKKLHREFSVFGLAGTEKRVSSSSCGSCSAHSCSTCKS